MIHLNVWLTFPDGSTTQVGELITSNPQPPKGGIQAQFHYSHDYLNHPHAFAIDPISLPLTKGTFEASRPKEGIHAVFEDALPDSWGRQLIIRKNKLMSGERRLPNLLKHANSNHLGALRFSEVDQLEPLEFSDIANLDTLLRAAQDFERGDDNHLAEFALLFLAGSSAGGARPKVVVKEDKQHWLAKFQSINDDYDIVRMEAASLHLAKMAGIEVPEHKIIISNNKPMLLVKRFDISPEQGRYHTVSFATLLKAEGYYYRSYLDIAKVIREVSNVPASDLRKLYRQMVFNIMLCNTDDHLKNFMMLHDNNGWRLSPAYDLLPNPKNRREHTISVGYDFVPPTMSSLLGLDQHFDLDSEDEAASIVSEVHQAMQQWQEVFLHYQVPEIDVNRLTQDINERVKDYEIAVIVS